MRTSPTRSSFSLLAASGILAILAAACSTSSTGGSPAASAAAPSAAAPSAAAPSSASSGEAYEVDVATGAMGKYLTGEDGKTLYVFTADSANKSACADTCATTWPPFTIDADESVKAGDGVTGTLATFARADGKLQVAINGLPLYYFKNDAKAGDTNGQGLNGKWFAANPAGTAPAASGAPASAAPSAAPKY